MRSSLSYLSKLSLLTFSCALCLVAAELVVRLLVPVRNVGPSFSRYDPVYGKALKRSISVTRITPEFTMRFTTNADGYRGPELKRPNAGSLVFLGDSFTMGYGVTDGEEFPALVRRALAGRHPPVQLEVINAGIGDIGNGRPLSFLRRDAAALKPRAIVLQIHANDFNDNVHDRFFELDPAGALVKLPVPPRGIARLVHTGIESVPGLAYSHLIGLLRQIRFGGGSPIAAAKPKPPRSGADERADRREHLMLAVQGEIVRTVRERGWPLLVVLVGLSERRRTLLEDFFRERAIPTVSIPAKNERPDLYFDIDGHWNTAGQAFAADRVLAALEPFELERW